jgi:hypothetical protein
VQKCTVGYRVYPEYTNPWEKRFYTENPSNIVRIIKSRILTWVGRVTRIGKGRSLYRVLAGKSKGKRPLGRPRHRWEDNMKMEL